VQLVNLRDKDCKKLLRVNKKVIFLFKRGKDPKDQYSKNGDQQFAELP